LNQRKNENGVKKSALLTRVLSALVMMPVAIYIILSGGMIYMLLVSLMSLLILFEWNSITRAKPLSLIFILQSLCVFYAILTLSDVLVLSQVSHQYIQVGFIAGLIVLTYLEKACLKFVFLGTLYALLPAISLIWLRNVPENGAYVVLWLMVIVWSMDTGAYFAGKNIGGPKLAPRISPNKTWAGLMGGIILAMGTGYAFILYSGLALFETPWMILIVSAMLALWSQIGDLFESALKRQFDVKDSGAIIPGHGGIMDRLDGIIFAAPAVALVLYL